MVKPGFHWDDERLRHLCKTYQLLQRSLQTKDIERGLSEEFTKKYSCELSGISLRIKAQSSVTDSKKRGRPPLFEWDFNSEDYLLDIFSEQPDGISRSEAQRDVTAKFIAQFPSCQLDGQSLLRYARQLAEHYPRDKDSAMNAEDERASDDDKDVDEHLSKTCLRYLRFGLKLSSKRLYNFTCSHCGVLISQRRGRRLFFCADNTTATIEEYFDVTTIPPYKKADGKKIVCSKCSNIRSSPLHAFAVCKEGTKHEVPIELAHLNLQEKCDLALTGLFSRTYRPQSRLFGVYKQTRGEYNCLHKDDPRYGDMHALIISNEDKVPRNKKRLYQALRFLRRENPLYQTFFTNYETLFRFYKPKPGDPSFVPVYGRDFSPQYLTTKKQMLENEKTKLALLIPSHDVHDSEDPYNTARKIQHPKIMHLEAELSHIFQTYLGYKNPTLEPKTWPYLFPYGKGGHQEGAFGSNLSFKDYVFWRILNAWQVFRQEQSYIFMMLDKMIKLDIMGFNYVRRINVQNQARDLTVKDIEEDCQNPYNRYGLSVPKTIKNSSNFWNSKFRELLALANEYNRPPDAFITLTQNDSWPEVQAYAFGGVLQDPPELLLSDENLTTPHGKSFPVNFPVEVSMAFYRRLAEFFGLVVHDKNGIFGEFTDYWARVELQQRGGLHLHFIGWTKKPIDHHISAELPRLDDKYNSYFRQLISKFQTHSCRDKCRVGPRGRKLGKCKYGFPFEQTKELKLDATGIRYEYIRSHGEDRNIASYNLPLLLLWQGHVNVQKVTENGWKMYLTKYISKPEKAENIVFADRDKPPSAPERFLKTRVCVSTEAAAILTKEKFVFTSRLFHFCTTDLQARRTLKRKEHMPKDKQSKDVFYKNQLDHYLDRPEALSRLTYDDYNRRYYFVYSAGGKQLARRQGPDAVPVYWAYAPYGQTQEPHYFQKYLMHRAVSRNMLDKIITSKNTTNTYLEQCLLEGITTEREEAEDYLRQSVNRGYGIDKLRSLAETLARENLFDSTLIEDLLKTVAPEHERVLAALEENVDDYDVETDENNVAQGKNATEDFIRSFTASQRLSYDYIVRKLSRHNSEEMATGSNQVLALITGEAGVGKSFMLKSLECLCRERGLAYRTLATTGVAAHLIGGQTIHSAFRLNVESLQSSISRGEIPALLIESLQVLFIDEFSMLTLDVFVAVDELCRKFTSNPKLRERPFGGKTVVMFGDVLQLEAIGRGIYLEDILKLFNVLILKEKCRQSDPLFIDLLNSIRVGILTNEHRKILQSKVLSLDRLPDPDDDDVMFLVPLRVQRDQINFHMLHKLDGEMVSFVAADFEPNRTKAKQSTIDAIRRTKTEKYFPSKIFLKKNAKVMLTRNRDISRGWCNGTLCRVKTLSTKPEFVIIERIGHTKALLDVQRIAHTFKLGKSSTECTREQFPLVPCYATTIHKAQGSTLKKIVIACNGMFASGAFYTALSRATTLDNVAFTDFDDAAVYCNDQFVQLWTWLQSRDVISAIDLPEVPFPMISFIPTKFTDLDPALVKISLPASFPTQDQTVKRKLYASSSDEELPPLSSSQTSNVSTGSLPTKINAISLRVSQESRQLYLSEQNAVEMCLINIRRLFESGKRGVVFFNDALRLIEETPELEVLRLVIRDRETVLFQTTWPQDSFASFYQQFRELYAIRTTRGDGNCCFRSISLALFGNDSFWPCLRLVAVNHLLKNRDHYWINKGPYDILSNSPTEHLEMDEHIYNSSFPYVNAPLQSWGSASHLSALSHELGRTIMTFRNLNTEGLQQQFDPRFVELSQAAAMIKSNCYRGMGYHPWLPTVPAKHPIRLFYTGDHYAPLLRHSRNEIPNTQDLIAGGMLRHNPNNLNIIDENFVIN